MLRNFTDQEIMDIIDGQKKFFSQGETLSYQFRVDQLTKLKESILKYQTQLEEALYIDLGKNRFESYTSEIGFILYSISHTIKHLKKWMKPEKKKTPISLMFTKSEVIKQPYGCVYIIGPYNYPFQLLIEPLIGAIAAGNCAILSPSELTPHVCEVIKDIVNNTFSANYICCVEGGIENNTLLLNSPVDYIFFTGSINVGKIVMQAAAKRLTPVTLELGGKSPVIIEKSANLKIASQRIVWGKLMNCGQTCVAPDYVLVPNELKDEFLLRLKETINEFYGEEIIKNKDYGRIVNDRHIQRLKKIIEKDKKYLFMGGMIDEKQRYIEPTILSLDNFEAASMQEEIFGPILPVIGYSDIGQALAYINSHDKPLALYVFSENQKAIDSIINNTASGGVAINETISHIINPNLPFGGIGSSGIGNYHGEYSFNTFSHQRSCLRKTTKLKLNLIYPPFNVKKLKNVKSILK